MSEFSAAEHKKNNSQSKRRFSAKKSLDNYIGQLKFHFELSDSDVIDVLNSVLKNKKDNSTAKRWWQVW